MVRRRRVERRGADNGGCGQVGLLTHCGHCCEQISFFVSSRTFFRIRDPRLALGADITNPSITLSDSRNRLFGCVLRVVLCR